jgi:heme-degrading monooxygenase HmoA
MIFEIARIEVKAGAEEEFEAAVAEGLNLFRRAKGCRSLRLERSIEIPSRYRLVIGWDTIENHMVDFRDSADFQTWRALVGHTLAALPTVEHTAVVLSGF